MSQVDGRILRSQKSQSIILDAIIKLINSGNYYPTAEEVAKESGIAIRTVFRQFADMESLLMKANLFVVAVIVSDYLQTQEFMVVYLVLSHTILGNC